MTTHPEVQKKAQAEIDAVIGSSRSPTIEDIDDLPYVQAIIQEVNAITIFLDSRSNFSFRFKGLGLLHHLEFPMLVPQMR